jgi:hypothetical protein
MVGRCGEVWALGFGEVVGLAEAVFEVVEVLLVDRRRNADERKTILARVDWFEP